MIAISGKHIVLPDGVRAGVVLIAEERIVAILDSLPHDFSGTVIDAGDKMVMPGVIDPHVHINEPGRTAWEGFETATRAAIAGGVTTLIDMPLNASPVTTTVAAFYEKQQATNGKLHTQVGFWGGLVPGNTDQIEPLIQAGVLGFKAFLTHSGIDDFPNVTRADLELAMPIIAKYNLPLLVHCELSDDTSFKPEAGTEHIYLNYLASRPKYWEDDAIAMMIELCERFQCRVHIVHLSSATALPQIIAARNIGLPLTVETGQHYLYFNAEEIPNGSPAYKCAPPIREAANNEQLWKALQAGVIDLVATDHSPSIPALKALETGNFMKAWGGIASIQFALPVLWTAAQKHGIEFSELSKWLCEAPAALAGLANRKGKIEVGFDADITIVDHRLSFTVREELVLHRHKVNPYMGQELYGVVTDTFLMGRHVCQAGQYLMPHHGTMLLR
ncbi:MAG: hypothetical protein RLY16_925 [Bacteroidota bacterium]|jgi:allantoinase